ncbi:T9SS type A sorting domain-containing protein, partial [Candidatus Latescibacterota bacterium]
LAPAWADELFDGTIGSVTHFFDSISFGQYKVTGEYLPKRYELSGNDSRIDNMFDYSLEVAKMLDNDPTVNLLQFDNEGRDGIPASEDDDGYVDYIVMMPMTVPYGFILQRATGVMYLGMKAPYRTHFQNNRGEFIYIDKTSGCLAAAANKNQAIGTIIAEISHAYGAIDLMDKVYVNPENDSAGVGYWDMLGRGALGWGGSNGPVGPSAYNRMLMNSIGYQNRNLVDLYGVHQNLRMKDVGHPDGKTYRVWIRGSEYFLIEYRSSIGGNYYDRQLPESGLLIWHIDERESNSTEKTKLCDLECADGKYIDKGYPLGNIPDPLDGSDNLDFWAHESLYTTKYNGNQGDATDVFDGVNFRSFGSETNPNSYSQRTGKPTGIEIFNIRKEGDEMVFDCFLSRIPEITPAEAPLLGMAFQRSRESSSYWDLLFWEKEVYIINFGFGQRANSLVTVTKDTLTVESLDFLNTYEAHKVVESHLLPANIHTGKTQIVRRPVSIESFRTIAQEYGVALEDIGDGQKPAWVQKAVRLSGDEIYTIESIDLHQNFPNPFNNQTTISYVLPNGSNTELEVYNILGQRVILVSPGYQAAGHHSIQLDASGLPSGMYMYRLKGISLSQTRKFTLIK